MLEVEILLEHRHVTPILLWVEEGWWGAAIKPDDHKKVPTFYKWKNINRDFVACCVCFGMGVCVCESCLCVGGTSEGSKQGG